MALRRVAKEQPPEPWEDRAQVVDVRRSRFEPAIVEIAVVRKAKDGGFVHRRVRSPAGDVDGALVFHPSPREAAENGSPSQPRWVHDDHFDTADGALGSAATTSPHADPREWRTRHEFKKKVGSQRFARQMQPAAADPSRWQALAAIVVYWICAGLVGLAAALGLFKFLEAVPFGGDAWAMDAWIGAVIGVGFAIVWAHQLGMWADGRLRNLLSRLNLDRAINGPQALSLSGEALAGFREWRQSQAPAREGRRAAKQERARRRADWRGRLVSGRRLEPGRHEAPRSPRRRRFGGGSQKP